MIDIVIFSYNYMDYFDGEMLYVLKFVNFGLEIVVLVVNVYFVVN